MDKNEANVKLCVIFTEADNVPLIVNASILYFGKRITYIGLFYLSVI